MLSFLRENRCFLGYLAFNFKRGPVFQVLFICTYTFGFELRGITTKQLILDYFEIANQIDETGASSAGATKIHKIPVYLSQPL